MTNSQYLDGFYKELGVNIREHRKRLKLSQDALARSIGLTRTSLTNIEGGRQHPPLHTFCDIVEQLKVDASTLLPKKAVSTERMDVKAMAGRQVRGDEELAFIRSGIGIKSEERPHGNTQTKSRNDSRETAG